MSDELTGIKLETTSLPETIKLQPAHLRLDHLVKRFGPTVAVNDVNLEIPKGSFATLLGPSGCGKTTLLRTIAAFTSRMKARFIWKTDRLIICQRTAANGHGVSRLCALSAHECI